jgi:hypothetical protein
MLKTEHKVTGHASDTVLGWRGREVPTQLCSLHKSNLDHGTLTLYVPPQPWTRGQKNIFEQASLHVVLQTFKP